MCVGWERVRRQEKRERERENEQKSGMQRTDLRKSTSASMDLTSQKAAGSADSSRCFYTGQNIDAAVSHT